MDAQEVIKLLHLEPLQPEGGYFRETYRCGEMLEPNSLPGRYDAGRPLSTAIYYLITNKTVSLMHRLKSDEVFHFYLGSPVTMLHLRPDGTSATIILGSDIRHGEKPQVVVPRGVWQGALLDNGGEWALLGTTVAPGFDQADFEIGEREQLLAGWPDETDMIIQLTHG